ncbi:MAG: hypothetical protein QXI85_00235 [Desulfurococcaceae archaeon]
MENTRSGIARHDPSRKTSSNPGGTHQRPYVEKPATMTAREKHAMPQPLGERCHSLCPLFVCTRNAMFVVNKPIKGRIIRVAQCRLTGGDCISGECQYASCRINSLLPDGRCTKALEKKVSRISDEDLFKQMRSFEEYDVSDLTKHRPLH